MDGERTFHDLERHRGGARHDAAPLDLRALGPVLPPSAVLPPEAVLATPVERAELLQMLGKPAYKLTAGERSWLVDARTGREWVIDRADATTAVSWSSRLWQRAQT